MPRDRTRGHSWKFSSLCVVLSLAALSGCQCHGNKDAAKKQADELEGRSPKGSSAPAVDDRIPRLTGPAIGMQPGYIEGGLLYASARLGALQTFLQSLPMSSREARDLAEFGELIGADPRTDDLLAAFGVDPNARISMSVRPVIKHAAEVRLTLERSPAIVDELVGRAVNVLRSDTPPPSHIDKQIDKQPAPLSARALDFARKSASLGMHVRVHVPVAAPNKFAILIDRINTQLRPNKRWTKTCAALPASSLCAGSSGTILVVRTVPGAVVADLLITNGGEGIEYDDPIRRALMQEAVGYPTAASLPQVERLRGDATLLIDGPRTLAVARADLLAQAISRLRWSTLASDPLDRFHKRDAALRQLHETERLFEGITVELAVDGKRMLATGRWLATPSGRTRMSSVFELDPIDADVPSIAALCAGATICGRSRGLPARERFASLATGVYADPKALGELIDEYEEQSMLVLLLETWPNAIGTTASLPGQTVAAPASMIMQSALDIGARTLGFGFSIRSQQSLTEDWIAYARMSSADLNALRGLLQLANMPLSTVTIPGIDGRVESTPINDPNIPGSFYSVVEGNTWGWALAADADDRVAWFAGLAHDDGAVPLAYLEIPDLWRVIATDRGLQQEFGFAQAWLSNRSVRVQLSLGDDRGPELRLALGKP